MIGPIPKLIVQAKGSGRSACGRKLQESRLASDPEMARSVSGGAPPPSRGTRRSFQNRFAESIFGIHPLSVGASAPPPVRDQGPGGSLPGPDAGHPLQAAGPVATDGLRRADSN